MRNTWYGFVALVLLAPSTSVPAQDKPNESVLKEIAKLRAENQSLKTEVERLKRALAKLPPAVSDEDKKYVRDLVNDFMKEMLTERHTSPPGTATNRDRRVLAFVSKKATYGAKYTDPNLIVAQIRTGWEKDNYNGPRRVYADYVFEEFTIESEAIAPSESEMVIKGTLKGNRTKWNWEEENSTGNYGAKIKIVAGSLGPRTGLFTIRVIRDNDTNNWLVSYFAWSVDAIKKDVEKK